MVAFRPIDPERLDDGPGPPALRALIEALHATVTASDADPETAANALTWLAVGYLTVAAGPRPAAYTLGMAAATLLASADAKEAIAKALKPK